ncbi:MAG: isochorismatase family protein, partial [Actinobacteria bacterium]|nr:isochorismatase family protein [Actinomycetota bacterium]
GRLNTTHLVIAGMTANLCCESTGRHAMEHGYDVTYIKDAIGAESLPAYEASVLLNYPLIANAVITVDDFLSAADGSHNAVRPGDTVFGSDHSEVGTVKDVVPASSDRRGYLLVPRGLIFEKDTFIPLDAVVKKAGDRVFINIPKLIVGKMPWSEPPSIAEYVEKLGPLRDQVEQLYGSRSPSAQM